jgi:hypothetical protein
MKAVEKILKSLKFLAFALVVACSGGSDDDDPQPPGPSGDLSITSTNDWPIWGEVMTIHGTGFSPTAGENIVRFLSYEPGWCDVEYTTEEGGDMQIISATSTELKVSVPMEEMNFGDCGPEYANIEVEVKGKKAKIENVKFVGPPQVNSFEYHWDWWDLPTITRIGDSVLLGGGLQGNYADESPYWNKLRLSIDGKPVPIKYRKIFNSTYGWAMFLPVSDFGEVNCAEGENGWNERPMTFKFYIEGTEIFDERDLNVQYLPDRVEITKVEGATSVSKSATLNPEWHVEGENMYYDRVRFVPQGGCGGNVTVVANVSPSAGFKNELLFGIPLVLLSENCTYAVGLIDPCDEGKIIGAVTINP